VIRTPDQRLRVFVTAGARDLPERQRTIQLSNGQRDRAARHFDSGLRAARGAPDRFTMLVSLYDLAPRDGSVRH